MKERVLPAFERRHGVRVIYVYFGPVNRHTRLDEATARRVPYGPDQVGRLVKLDFQAMNDHLAEWAERWNKEIERR